MSLKEKLESFIAPERVRTRYIDRVSFASDAGFYYLVPQAIVQPVNEEEIVSLFRFSAEENVPLVFRAGGTSLSGQSVTDGILVDLAQHWRGVTVEEEGRAVRVQPGITGAMVNAHLRRYRAKIGPDPSSISAAMMGGILSNNSSGMCCGVKLNSYHTLKHIRFILPDGKTFSTEKPSDYIRFETECPTLFSTLAGIRERILADRQLHDRIRQKYEMKTTVGYSLNAFVDFEHPLDIMAHLLVGAEGTLAFIAEAVLRTVPDYPHKSTALLYFPDIYAACQAIVPLTQAGAMMVELADRAALRSVEHMPGMPAALQTLPDGAAALLIEFQEHSPEALENRVEAFLRSANQLSLLEPPVFTRDPVLQDLYWKMRKGMFPAVGAVRKSGTTVVLEDIAFPVARLGDAIIDLQTLFARYHYDNAIIFGHAKDGNIHFVVTQSFNTEEEIQRYDRFMREVVTLVVDKYDGTLKAEHGTGRNMAPFVETEWGGEAYEILRVIKDAVDPRRLLNPGVIINDDKDAHLRFLKALPTVEEEVDRCIECGYCEHRCPSRDITTTPRRRIVVRRVLKRLEQQGDQKHYRLLRNQYNYDGLETCAVDGLCAAACPVSIDTGDLTKRLRRENHSVLANRIALTMARNFGWIEGTMRAALYLGTGVNKLLGQRTMSKLTFRLRKVFPSFPRWSNQLQAPPARLRLKHVAQGLETVVYFPACISRMMGRYEGKEKDLLQTFLSVCRKARFDVVVPDDVAKLCCGQMFSSKGFAPAYQHTARNIFASLWRATQKGHFPVVVDVTSCAFTLQKMRFALSDEDKVRFDQLRILDSVAFLHDEVLPRIAVRRQKENIVLHPVCSLQKMKMDRKFLAVAQAFSKKVTIPENAGCCGMAGDRGFLFPELTASATEAEAAEVRQETFDGYYSSTRTCEMAMSEAVQHNYESILYLVDEGGG